MQCDTRNNNIICACNNLLFSTYNRVFVWLTNIKEKKKTVVFENKINFVESVLSIDRRWCQHFLYLNYKFPSYSPTEINGFPLYFLYREVRTLNAAMYDLCRKIYDYDVRRF